MHFVDSHLRSGRPWFRRADSKVSNHPQAIQLGKSSEIGASPISRRPSRTVRVLRYLNGRELRPEPGTARYQLADLGCHVRRTRRTCTWHPKRHAYVELRIVPDGCYTTSSSQSKRVEQLKWEMLLSHQLPEYHSSVILALGADSQDARLVAGDGVKQTPVRHGRRKV